LIRPQDGACSLHGCCTVTTAVAWGSGGGDAALSLLCFCLHLVPLL
jgi:hypothetical protein